MDAHAHIKKDTSICIIFKKCALRVTMKTTQTILDITCVNNGLRRCILTQGHSLHGIDEDIALCTSSSFFKF